MTTVDVAYQALCAGRWSRAAFRAWLAPAVRPELLAPEWDGVPYPGLRLWVAHEGGHGDALMLVRYAETLARAGVIVHWQGTKETESLLARAPGVSRVHGDPDHSEAIVVDRAVRAMDLPALLFATPDRVGGASVPYLKAPGFSFPRRRSTVGICWHGGLRTGYGPERDLGEIRARQLVDDIDVPWVSVIPGESIVGYLHDAPPGLARGATFAETARLLRTLRCLVTTDTAVAHLAGALGITTHLLLHYHADWRWVGRWYPTMTLHRQTSPGAWKDPLRSVMTALEP